MENLVGFVKGSFFKQRRFHDEADLRAPLAEWHREVNDERPCRATQTIPTVRLAEEQPRLRALTVRSDDLALRVPVVVGPPRPHVARALRLTRSLFPEAGIQ